MSASMLAYVHSLHAATLRLY